MLLGHAIGIGGAVDAVIDGREIAANGYGRRIVEGRQKLGIGLGLGGGNELAAIVERDRHEMRLAVIDAGADDLGLVATDLQPDAQHGPCLQRRRVEQLGDGVAMPVASSPP